MSAPRAATRIDRLICLLAAGGGLGYLPQAPGTFGSLLGPLWIWAIQHGGITGLSALSVVGVLAFLVGTVLSTRAIQVSGSKDPQFVVCDEFLAFAWVYLLVSVNWSTAVTGFLLFRLFDITKPGPVSWAERLPGGWGVMADDAVAGLLAGGCLYGLARWLPQLFAV